MGYKYHKEKASERFLQIFGGVALDKSYDMEFWAAIVNVSFIHWLVKLDSYRWLKKWQNYVGWDRLTG